MSRKTCFTEEERKFMNSYFEIFLYNMILNKIYKYIINIAYKYIIIIAHYIFITEKAVETTQNRKYVM